MILQNIEDVFKILDSDCEQCGNDFREYPGYQTKYDSVIKKDGKAVFSCERRWHGVYEAFATFETSEKDFKNLEEEIKEITNCFPWPQESDSDTLKEERFRLYNRLNAKIQACASFAPRDLKIKINGFCNYCGDKIKIAIEGSKVLYGCSDCASVIADAASG
ncbi:MAG: hypothetical protein PHH54_01275 [Candidatus Nanoarchaeia archaeon]|nr:hypothetical protein [Candidatus Nanoarchaeia archaeon]MDD5740594.1 hypothetical protein [Candidatus Nanoarchaeia archaeon]